MAKVAKTLGAALAGISSAVGAAIAFLEWAGIEFDGLMKEIANLLPLWFPSMLFIFGICIGWYARGRSQGTSRSMRKYLEECDRARREESFEKVKRTFYELDADLKALMLAALDKGGAYCSGDDWRCDPASEEPFITQFVATRYIDGDIAKITALPLLEQFRESVPDAFDGVSSTLERHARDRGSRVNSSFGTSREWWWYR